MAAPKSIGYARVSTTEQETQLQINALNRAGVSIIFQEKASSVGARPQLQKALKTLSPGDTIVVWKIDRLARSLADLLQILDFLKSEGIHLKSLTEPIDTASPIGIFMMQILGAVAQLEKSIIRERTIAGQVAAIERGVVFGRKKLLTIDQERDALAKIQAGIPMTVVAREYGVSLIVIRRIKAESQGIYQTGRHPVLKAYLKS